MEDEREAFGSPRSVHSFCSSINNDEARPHSFSDSRQVKADEDESIHATRRADSFLRDTLMQETLTEKTPLFRQSQRRSFLGGSRTSSIIHNISHAFSGSIRKLEKNLGFAQGFFLIVGILIGSGIFLSPSLVAKTTANMGIAVILWITCGIIALFGALCFCELGCALQKAGGNYAYILEAYGPLPAFLCSWTTVLIIDPAAMAAVTLTFGTYAVKPFYDNDQEIVWLSKILAVVCIFLVSLVNCLSVRASTKAQTVFTTAQILAVCFIIVLGVWQIAIGKTDNIVTMFHNDNSTSVKFGVTEIGQLSIALYNGLWSYDGWALVSNVTEEMHDLERNLLLSIITGIPFVVFCYVAINLSFLSVLTRNEIASSPTTVIHFVDKILGRKVAYVMPLLVALSCFGAANGTIFSCGRLTLAAAREGHMPSVFGMIHKRRLTPIPAIILASFISALMLLPNASNLESLIGYFNFACWTIYGVSIFAVVVLRIRKPDLHRPFKIWLFVPILMSLVSLLLVLIPFFNKPIESSITMAVILSGVPMYVLLVHFKDKHCSCFKSFKLSFNRIIQKSLNLAPCKY